MLLQNVGQYDGTAGVPQAQSGQPLAQEQLAVAGRIIL